ncbi:T-cell surface glycoprotein CD3 epsilon chain-like [Sebastes umbrosus]|uniref:T-cell surface glycoprotein CD3 epsilon chain-like n=1 Tax=Sebastes umbrosus TaxID=72105 RepID=UPI00189DCE5A|nr:T-cell surface glycoprotein CD3 epsilon chain-like [Sebastes umbrosus]
MGVRATLAVLLLFIATVEAGEGGVEFWKLDFTMICPEKGNWSKKTEATEHTLKEKYKLQYDGKTKGSYYCEWKDTNNHPVKYYFYVKGKVCKDCFELDASLFGLVIAVDVLATAIVMMVIFKCTKKKSSAGLSQASKAPARSGGRAQAAQSPTYEPLSPHTRAQDPYSVVNRMG